MGCVDNAEEGFGRSGKKRKGEGGGGRWRHLALIPRYTINYYIRITRVSSSSAIPSAMAAPRTGVGENCAVSFLRPTIYRCLSALQLIAVTWQTG